MKKVLLASVLCSGSLLACVGDGGFVPEKNNDPDNPDVTDCRPSDVQDIYKDIDGDGYGDPATADRDCIIPEGYVTNALDCDDTEPRSYDGATELCGDKIDNNCSGSDVCATSLAAHWSFAESTGTDALDYSGNQINGLLRNGLVHSPSAFLSFDGSDDFVEVLDTDLFQLTAGTVAFWFMPSAIGDQQALVSKDSNGRDAGGQMTIYLNNDGLVRAKLESANQTYDIVSIAPVTPGQWHHVAFTFGGNEGMTIYVDDIEGGKDPYTGGLLRNKEPLAIGVGTDNSGNLTVEPINQPFNGQIADVEFYDRQLLREELTGLTAVTDPRLSGL